MANPYRPFGLTEITRRLNLNKATCHAILITMTQYGFLVQHPRNKSYRLGPSIVAAANSALARFPLLEYARLEFEKLSNELECGMAVTAISNRQQVLLALYGNTSSISEAFQLGLRLPNTAPIAACFAAFAPAREMEAWIERAHSGIGEFSDKLDKALRVSLIHIRSRGFEVTLRTDAEQNLIERLSVSQEHWGLNELDEHCQLYQQQLCQEHYILDEYRRDKRYLVNTLSVPIFLYDESPAMCLVAGSLRQSLSGADITHMSDRMRVTAEKVRSMALAKAERHRAP
ncbi:helix-turn-helix domain-containing protein [Parahaliea aestuarii]|uniref:Helix-turn-helix domain-containing protein n=2 Tax=Parahaliea aestuarii TaxID=1852021 RepID=A0A5C8ZVM5_9GAMM|nr:helix-turn-helix domain-containing protein [Parahaliea aestuarii]